MHLTQNLHMNISTCRLEIFSAVKSIIIKHLPTPCIGKFQLLNYLDELKIGLFLLITFAENREVNIAFWMCLKVVATPTYWLH